MRAALDEGGVLTAGAEFGDACACGDEDERSGEVLRRHTAGRINRNIQAQANLWRPLAGVGARSRRDIRFLAGTRQVTTIAYIHA